MRPIVFCKSLTDCPPQLPSTPPHGIQHCVNAAATIDDSYQQALAAVEQTLDRVRQCSDEEKTRLRAELAGLRQMHDKLTSGRVEIVVFGEISTGKSALINALVGRDVASVDVRGGWTREIWHVAWDGTGYTLPGLGESQVVLVDTPGINEVGGGLRGEMAREAAQRSDLVLFVTDSDLNETEHSALVEFAAFHKPLIVVLNKVDLYSREQHERLLRVIADERLDGIVPPEHVITATADPRQREYIIQAADGSRRHGFIGIDVSAQGRDLRQIDAAHGGATGARRRIRIVHRRPGRPVLLRARRKLGQRESQGRRQADSRQHG